MYEDKFQRCVSEEAETLTPMQRTRVRCTPASQAEAWMHVKVPRGHMQWYEAILPVENGQLPKINGHGDWPPLSEVTKVNYRSSTDPESTEYTLLNPGAMHTCGQNFTNWSRPGDQEGCLKCIKMKILPPGKKEARHVYLEAYTQSFCNKSGRYKSGRNGRFMQEAAVPGTIWSEDSGLISEYDISKRGDLSRLSPVLTVLDKKIDGLESVKQRMLGQLLRDAHDYERLHIETEGPTGGARPYERPKEPSESDGRKKGRPGRKAIALAVLIFAIIGYKMLELPLVSASPEREIQIQLLFPCALTQGNSNGLGDRKTRPGIVEQGPLEFSDSSPKLKVVVLGSPSVNDHVDLCLVHIVVVVHTDTTIFDSKLSKLSKVTKDAVIVEWTMRTAESRKDEHQDLPSLDDHSEPWKEMRFEIADRARKDAKGWPQPRVLSDVFTFRAFANHLKEQSSDPGVKPTKEQFEGPSADVIIEVLRVLKQVLSRV